MSNSMYRYPSTHTRTFCSSLCGSIHAQCALIPKPSRRTATRQHPTHCARSDHPKPTTYPNTRDWFSEPPAVYVHRLASCASSSLYGRSTYTCRFRCAAIATTQCQKKHNVNVRSVAITVAIVNATKPHGQPAVVVLRVCIGSARVRSGIDGENALSVKRSVCVALLLLLPLLSWVAIWSASAWFASSSVPVWRRVVDGDGGEK